MTTHETLARATKSAKLAAVCIRANATPEMVRNFSREQWRDIASLAGCHPPNSQATVDEW